MLRRLCARSLPCRACLWGRATGDGHHPCIRLHHTGRAHPARLKRDAHFQGAAGVVVSTCHDGLLAPVARAWQGATPYAVVPRETRPHSRGAVVCVECSSKTLPACWQLCRKCTHSALWRPRVWRRAAARCAHACWQPWAPRGGADRPCGQPWTMVSLVTAAAARRVESPWTALLPIGRRLHGLQRLHRAAPGAQSLGVRLAACLPCRFQGRGNDGLPHPVLSGR